MNLSLYSSFISSVNESLFLESTSYSYLTRVACSTFNSGKLLSMKVFNESPAFIGKATDSYRTPTKQKIFDSMVRPVSGFTKAFRDSWVHYNNNINKNFKKNVNRDLIEITHASTFSFWNKIWWNRMKWQWKLKKNQSTLLLLTVRYRIHVHMTPNLYFRPRF